MSGKCVTKMPHSCGTKRGLQVYENEDGTLDGYCWSCKKYVENPLGVGVTIDNIPKSKINRKTEEEIIEEMEEISSCGVIDLENRRLRASALDYFGIKVGVDETDGSTPKYVFFPYTNEGSVVRWKIRLLQEKRFWNVGLSDVVDLFGWEQARTSKSSTLIITEGEFDAVALRRILEMYTKEEYLDNMPAVVSLQNGVKSAGKELAKVAGKISKLFTRVILCFDDDEVGRAGVADACIHLPQATSVTLPYKDANECLIKGVGKKVFNLIMFNNDKPKNSRLIWGREVHESAKKPAEFGYSTPWEGLTELTRGWRRGETIYLGAGEKLGKSEMVNAIAADLIKTHDLKVMLAKPEEAINKTYKMLLSKIVGRVFHDPKIEFDEEAYERGGEIIRDRVCMLDLYQNIVWESLKQDIITAKSLDVSAVFIDPITNLTNGMSSSEVNSFLTGFSQEIATLTKDLDIITFMFCHLNKPAKGKLAWDRGGQATTADFAGSSAMARSCNYAFSLEGNKDPDLSEYERNTRKLVLLADREFGESGYVNLFWNRSTSLFTEI